MSESDRSRPRSRMPAVALVELDPIPDRGGGAADFAEWCRRRGFDCISSIGRHRAYSSELGVTIRDENYLVFRDDRLVDLAWREEDNVFVIPPTPALEAARAALAAAAAAHRAAEKTQQYARSLTAGWPKTDIPAQAAANLLVDATLSADAARHAVKAAEAAVAATTVAAPEYPRPKRRRARSRAAAEASGGSD